MTQPTSPKVDTETLINELYEAARHKSYWSYDDTALVQRAAKALRALSAPRVEPDACRRLIKQIDDLLHDGNAVEAHKELHELAHEFEKISPRSVEPVADNIEVLKPLQDLKLMVATNHPAWPAVEAMDREIGKIIRKHRELVSMPYQPDAGVRVIEQSENMNGHQMMTVKSNRGDEYVVNADAVAKTLAQLLSDHAHEKKMGWELGPGWFLEAFSRLRRAALPPDAGSRKPALGSATVEDDDRQTVCAHCNYPSGHSKHCPISLGLIAGTGLNEPL